MKTPIENHEDKSTRKLLHRLGPGDEDVIGTALDTGWLATNGAEVVKTVAECLRVLMRRGYRGGISIEHEPETFDPTEDCRAGLLLVRQILEQSS